MGAANFYHLTRRPVEVVLPQLLERALGQGWRVLVRGRDPRRMDQIDAALWISQKPASCRTGWRVAAGMPTSRCC